MNWYSLVVSLHVIIAILGLGLLTALALAFPLPVERMAQMLRIVGLSLLGMLISGAGIIAMTHGAWGETRWMRISFGLFLALGALHGVARRQLRRLQQATDPAASGPPLQPPRWIFRAMGGLVIAITWLMEAKPW